MVGASITEVVRGLLVVPLLSYFLLFPPFIRGPLGGQERASPSQEEGGGPVLGGGLASAGHAGRKTRLSILLQQFSY